VLEPLSGHAVFLLLVQLTLLLVAARFGSEIAQRLGLPSVVGELAAGIVLGPTVLGHFSPELFALVFPQDVHQFHMLEVVGMLGMVLLLLLTGLETDLRLLKNLGRAALIASFMGMAVPFATGYGLGLWMPDAYLAQPDKRMLFSFFLATAMSISAMPVIAKMLMDLDLTKRNIGLVILSAGVIDDTAGWLILSVIAGAARHGGEVQVGNLVSTVLLTGAFVGVAAFAIYPISRGIIRIANRNFKTDDADLLFLLVITFACAAATEWIGIHAVFGAFVAGTLFRQVTHLKAETVHRLESFVFTVLAPIFFGVVGLKVDLWKLGGGQMLGIVLAVACLGKLIGCTIGSMWGGLRFWEGLSIAVAMNARGAMELVVATIGLSLGILNQEMFSIIVVVAVVTSFLAPLGLRLTMRMVRMTQEEVQRMVAEQTKGLFDPETLRVLLPTTGFSNAGAVMLAAGLAKRSVNPVDVLLIETETPVVESLHPLSHLQIEVACCQRDCGPRAARPGGLGSISPHPAPSQCRSGCAE
jgi:Kef-type K+ transport system membrane component KefB